MSAELFWVSALLLLPERLAYLLIWRSPDAYRRMTARLLPRRDPVGVLAALFVVFKGIQLAVFATWYVVHAGRVWPLGLQLGPASVGAALVLAGQLLNVSVFATLGRVGVFYGSRLGHEVQWVRGFPFSWLEHPQYVGTVLSIWGAFVALRYPAPDWAALPALETAYYVIGAYLEREHPAIAAVRRAPRDPA